MVAQAADIARTVSERLDRDAERLRKAFGPAEPGRVRCCWVDDLLPEDVLGAALRQLPPLSAMVRRRNMKERKYVTAQLNRLDETIRNLVAAFNTQPVADAIARIMGKQRLEIDPRLYNGGITAMVPGDSMCPHLDNSHDYDRARRRDVVLLYYMSPWRSEYGGHLELWDDDRRAPPRAIEYRGNRLVVMETTDHSWHSIRPVVGPMPRVNVTSYYYAPATERSPLRLTHFASWPEHRMRGVLFDGEFRLRSFAARMLDGKRLRANRHVYQPAPQREGESRPAEGQGPSLPG